MRRFLAGCLMGVLVIGALVGVSLYFTWDVLQPAVRTVDDVTSGAGRLRAAIDIDRDLRHRDRFVAPGSGELSADQVERWIRVQQQVRASLGARGDAFAAKYRELSARGPDGTMVVPSLQALAGGARDLSDVYLDAWRAQVAAMNVEGFSRDEFSWVRRRVYQAAGLDAVRYDAREVEQALADLARGARLQTPDVRLPDAPAANRALVKPHQALLRSWLGMAFFGL